jgi:YD repeat-containing protein
MSPSQNRRGFLAASLGAFVGLLCPRSPARADSVAETIPPGKHARPTVTWDYTYITTYTYDSSQLAALVSRDGRRTTFVYDSAGKLASWLGTTK